MKVCFYAINGHGLGHLSRCHAIAKRLHDLLFMVGINPDIQILTTSDADYIVKDFPVFKIPSRSCFKGRSGPSNRYSTNGKMMISAMLSHFSPDVLVMDTIATGSFNEFTFIKDFAKKTALIERHKNSGYRESPVHQSHLPLFSKIIIPDEIDHIDDYSLSESVKPKTSCVGMVHNFDPSRALSRDEVRQCFGVGEKKIAYLSAGGGGDQNAHGQLTQLVEAFSDEWHLIIGYGPLSEESKIYHLPNVSAVTESEIWRYFKGLDFAVCAAGYNTYEELLAAKVPTMFFAQTKGLDEQERRVSKGVQEGWHGEIDLTTEAAPQIDHFLSSFNPAALHERAPTQGSCAAALQIALLNPAIAEAQVLELEFASVIQEWLMGHVKTLIDAPEVFRTYQAIFQPDTGTEQAVFILGVLQNLEEAFASGNLTKNLRHAVKIHQVVSQQPEMNRSEIRRIHKELRANLYQQLVSSSEVDHFLNATLTP